MPPVGFMEKNDIADDVIRASCRLKYHGNQKPRFQWRWSDKSTVNSTEEDSESTTIVSTAMTRPRKELNGAKLTCTATVSDRSNAQDSSSSFSAQWTSHEVTVLRMSFHLQVLYFNVFFYAYLEKRSIVIYAKVDFQKAFIS